MLLGTGSTVASCVSIDFLNALHQFDSVFAYFEEEEEEEFFKKHPAGHSILFNICALCNTWVR